MVQITNRQGRPNDQVITAEAAAAATLLLTLVPRTNLSLKAAASVRLSLALSRPSVMYCPTCLMEKAQYPSHELADN